MIDSTKPLRIGKIWDLSNDEITGKTPDEIKLIILYRNKILSKVTSGEWTEDEYKKFSSTIKKIYLEEFMYFNDIFDCFLKLSKEEILEEINNLVEKRFIKTDSEINIGLLSNVINEICSRILSISYMCVNDDEKNNNLPYEQQVEICNSILEQLYNSNSEYVKFLINTFTNWVENNFTNKKLKEVILNKKDFIVSNKEKIIRKKLNKNFRTIKKIANVHDRYQYVNITSYKAKKIMKKKNNQ